MWPLNGHTLDGHTVRKMLLEYYIDIDVLVIYKYASRVGSVAMLRPAPPTKVSNYILLPAISVLISAGAATIRKRALCEI